MSQLKWACFAALAAAISVGPGCAGRRQPSLVPQPDVEMDAALLGRFYEEVRDYVRLRVEASKMVPPLANASGEEMAQRQRAIADVIRTLRKHAKQGDIFTKPIAAAFRRIISREIRGPEGPAILGELRSGNPAVEGVPKASDPTQEVKTPVALRANGYYPAEAPFSSVPPSLLLKLPQLPDQVRYRFVGRALIIRDTDANVILDYVADVVPDPTLPR
jgi:hypothetical protein